MLFLDEALSLVFQFFPYLGERSEPIGRNPV